MSALYISKHRQFLCSLAVLGVLFINIRELLHYASQETAIAKVSSDVIKQSLVSDRAVCLAKQSLKYEVHSGHSFVYIHSVTWCVCN